MTVDEAVATLGLDKPTSLEKATEAFEDLCTLLDPETARTPQLRERSEQHLEKVRQAHHLLKAHFGEDTAEGLNAKGLEYHKAGRHADAIEAFSDAIEKDKQYSFYYNRGLTRVQAGDYEKAIDDVKHATIMEPDRLELRETLARLHLRMAKYGLARREYEVLRRQDPRNAAVLYDIAVSWALEGSSVGKASAELRKAIAIDRSLRDKAMADPDFRDVMDHPAFQGWKQV